MDAPPLGDEEPVAVEEDQTVCWSLPRRLVFCFVCAYLVLFIVGGFTNSVWSPLNIWLGVHLFHLSGQAVTIVRTGSSDTALAYVQEFWVVVLDVSKLVLVNRGFHWISQYPYNRWLCPLLKNRSLQLRLSPDNACFFTIFGGFTRS